MFKLIETVDEIFSLFIQDSFGRFVLLHLPFWFISLDITWFIVAYLGPIAILFTLFVLLPALMAAGFLFVAYTGDYNPDLKRLKIAVPVELVVLIVIVGIPHWFFGMFFQALREETIARFYWGFLRQWMRFFNAIQPFHNQPFASELYDYNFYTLQWFFWGVSLTVTPFVFWVFYNNDKEKREEERKALEAAEKELERKKQAEKRQRIYEEEYNKKEAKEAEIKKMIEDKKQERLREIKDEDPWNSGFL